MGQSPSEDSLKTLRACPADAAVNVSAAGGDVIVFASNRFQTRDLPTVFEQGVVDVGKAAPGAGYLLTAGYPYLPLDQAIEAAPR